MAWYIFIRTENQPSDWELMEVLKSRQIAARALKSYERMVGSRKATGKEVVMVEADSVDEAKRKLEYQDGETN